MNYQIADPISLRIQIAPYKDGTYKQKVVWAYEVFKPIPNLERYWISTLGRLYDSYESAHCIPTIDRYIRYALRYNENDFFYESAQRLMMTTFRPVQNMENLKIVFLDQNPHNLRLDNMQWMDTNQKQQFMADNGIGSVGENHYQTKYSEEQIRKICELLQKGYKYNKIQELLPDLPYDQNFSQLCVRLRTGRGWKHVISDYNIKILNERFTDEFVHRVCDLLELNKSNKEIAQILGIENNVRLQSLCGHLRGHKPTYQKFLNAHPNIPLVTAESRGISLKDTEEIAKLVSLGYKNYEIVEKMNKDNPRITSSSISRIVKRLKYPKDKNVKGYDIAHKYGIIQNNI